MRKSLCHESMCFLKTSTVGKFRYLVFGSAVVTPVLVVRTRYNEMKNFIRDQGEVYNSHRTVSGTIRADMITKPV